LSEAGGESVVPEAHLGPPADCCPVCESPFERAVAAVLQKDPAVHMLLCGRCGAASADRMPDEAFLKSLYAPDRYASDLLASEGATRRCGAHVARHLPPLPDRDLRLLDYGGHDGSLARAVRDALRRRGHPGPIECTVVDYFVDERGADDLRFLDVQAFAQDTTRYDVVLASAVLEHLPDLPAVARRLVGACRPGGVLYARTPWELPLARHVPGYRLRWPRHLHDLGPRFYASFRDRFAPGSRVLRSAPSPVESDFLQRPARTAAATLLKAPGHLEARLLAGRVAGSGRTIWPFVGGWEMVLALPPG